MKQMLKQAAAWLLAAVMVVTMALPAMAENNPDKDQVKTPTGNSRIETPSANDKAMVYIQGFEDENVTVKAYQIVKANYYKDTDPQSGFAGYEIVYSDHKTDANKSVPFVETTQKDENGNPVYVANYPTSEQINVLASNLSGLTAVDIKAFTKEGGTYTASGELAVGEWLVIAEDKDGEYVYNPMVVSVYYTDNGGKVAVNKIAITDDWNWKDHDVALATTNAYVKSTKPAPYKEIADSDIDSKNSGKHGNDTAVGKTVKFKIGATIPSYSQEYFSYKEESNGKVVLTEKKNEKAVVFKIKDTLDKGLTLDRNSILVKVNGTAIAASNYTLTYNPDPAQAGKESSFEITLKKDYLKSLAGKSATERAIEVTYQAAVNEYATTNFDANKNTMKVTYNNKPDTENGDSENTNVKEIEDTTYHYTFEIDGKIDGTGTGKKYDKTTHELIKINEKGEPIAEKTFVEGKTEEYEVPQAVQGAIFKLEKTSDEDKDKGATYYAITDKNGYFVADAAANKDKEYNYTVGSNKLKGSDIKGFKQMDVGTYELTEVVAPSGYSLDTKKHTVVISAEYYSEDGKDKDGNILYHKGQMKSYEIKIDGTQTSTYTATYSAGVVEEVENLTEGGVQTTYIKNTRIPALPSTGGRGIFLFTMIGVAVMSVIAYLFFNGKREDKRK